MYYRIANAFYYYKTLKSGVEMQSVFRNVARKLSETSKVKTGIDIHPGAIIGEKFVIDHGVGTVIGETCVIGRSCYILQGVILGAEGIANNKAEKRHPTIGNNQKRDTPTFNPKNILHLDCLVGLVSV